MNAGNLVEKMSYESNEGPSNKGEHMEKYIEVATRIQQAAEAVEPLLIDRTLL